MIPVIHPKGRPGGRKALGGPALAAVGPCTVDRATESNRNLTIAVCAEILAKVGQKESQADSQF